MLIHILNSLSSITNLHSQGIKAINYGLYFLYSLLRMSCPFERCIKRHRRCQISSYARI